MQSRTSREPRLGAEYREDFKSVGNKGRCCAGRRPGATARGCYRLVEAAVTADPDLAHIVKDSCYRWVGVAATAPSGTVQWDSPDALPVDRGNRNPSHLRAPQKGLGPRRGLGSGNRNAVTGNVLRRGSWRVFCYRLAEDAKWATPRGSAYRQGFRILPPTGLHVLGSRGCG